MKKALSLFLALIMLLSLCACGEDSTQNTDPSTNPSQATTGSTQNPTDGTGGTTGETQAPTSAPTTAPTEAPTTPPTTCSHSYKDATCTDPKTCSKCGATEGNAAGHSWKDATCTDPKTCSKCGATEGNAAGHSWKDATCTDPKTCSKCGATEGSAAGHSWKDATCTAPKTCSACGATEGSAAEHNYQDGTCAGCGAAEPDAVVVGRWFLEGITNDGSEYEKMYLTLGEGTASISISYYGRVEYDSQEMLDAILANGYYSDSNGDTYYYNDIFQHNGVYYYSLTFGTFGSGTYTVNGSTITAELAQYGEGPTSKLVLKKTSEDTLSFVSIAEDLFDEIIREVFANGRVFTKVADETEAE